MDKLGFNWILWSWVPYKFQEISAADLARGRNFWDSCGFQRFGTHSSTESKCNNRSVSVIFLKRSSDSTKNCSADWEPKLLCSSSSASPSPLRVLQRQQILQLSMQKNFERKFCLSQEAKKELVSWVNNLKLSNSRSLVNSKPQIIIASVASLKILGAYCQDQKIGGLWSKLETMEHINLLDLKATKFALLTFTKIFPQAKIIHLQMENIAVLFYLPKWGGYSQQGFVRPSQRNLGLPYSEWDHDYCKVFTRNTQWGSRSSITVSDGFQRMETEPTYFQKDLQSLLDPGHRPFCLNNISSSTSKLCLEIGYI